MGQTWHTLFNNTSHRSRQQQLSASRSIISISCIFGNSADNLIDPPQFTALAGDSNNKVNSPQGQTAFREKWPMRG